jgi:hypothetical protein
MIWLTWRQFRISAVVAVAGLAVIAIVLAATHPSGGGTLSHDHLLKFLSTFLVALPALTGAFWGAPLIAGELESGTYRLAWTQSVTPTHWLAIKVGLIGLASVAATGALSLMLTAWSSATVNSGRFGSAMFAERGIAPLGYAAFGFALGVTAGLLIRRTLPAMAVTLVGFLAVRIVVQSSVRPHFGAPVRLAEALSANNGSPVQGRPGAWVVSNTVFDAAGHVIDNIRCGSDARSCMAQYHQVVTYQPASRYWAFQSYETVLFAGLGLILLGFSLWWTRTRLS